MTKVGEVTPKFNNGDRVKDIVTGVTGIVTATTVWMNGCIRYNVQTEKPKDGRPTDLIGYDENDLKLVKADAIAPTPVRKTGAPQCGESVSRRQV